MSLEILTSDAFSGIKHGFFTRKGGASSGIFAGLNCGTGSSDQSDAVRCNRAKVAQAMGVKAEALFGVHQTHSSDVIVITKSSTSQAPRPKADAMVTRETGVALGG